MAIKKIALTIVLFLLVFFVVSCREDQDKSRGRKPQAKTNAHIDAAEDTITGKEDYSAMLVPHQENLEGYSFRYGYKAYNEDKYGFSNPGYLEVRKGNTVVFKDTFKGEGEPYVTSLGYHDLDGNKLIFQLNYGTEACDYTQHAKYYVADDKENFRFIKTSWSGTGGDQYASRYFTQILPGDSLGKPNTLTIVEGITFNEHDQPDRADTTHVVFSGGTFKISKLTDNLSKAK